MGVKSEFSRLTKDDPRISRELRAFLFRAARLKEIADYELGPGDRPKDRVAAEQGSGSLVLGVRPPH